MREYLRIIFQNETADPKDAKKLFEFYHLGDKKVEEITLNTILKVGNITPSSYSYLRYPNNKKFAVVLSHDVDLVRPSWRYYAYHLIKKPKIGFNLLIRQKNPYNTFEKIIELEKKFGTKSTFFFMAVDKDPTGIRYRIEDFKGTLRMILDEGFEVGLHGSYTAYNDLNQLKKEKSRLERVTGEKVQGYRNHYLRFKIPETWKLLEKAGFKYDSTIGYNDLVGFRGGVPYPFYGFDPASNETFKVLEIPLNVMDGTLFEYMRLSVDKAFELVKKLMDIVEEYHGILTLNWHNDKFDGIYWRHYEELYVKILKEAKKRDAWLTNGIELVEWWVNENLGD
ncbi:polysaccharide deacetylase family protein [Pyrococcus kukulkanii]|uniref:polysaccharide deacetylase family protein n=1 Tax=Pyrococcus kukulkanii TaxID=1609559 RepID=UPI00083081D7|nr:polysaccharide deacetylase family protein [Pyrococcus kukulkanii]